MTTLNFDASGVQPDMGFDPIPVGWYNVMMIESEMKPTKDNSGNAYLECVFKVLDGQYAGRKLYARMNLRHTNPVTQEIAFKQLSAVAHAVQVLQVQDSQQLHNIPLKVKVKIRKDKSGEYEDQNDITQFQNINYIPQGAAPAGPAPGAAFAGQVPPAQGQQPWVAPQGQQQPAGWGAPGQQQVPQQQMPPQQMQQQPPQQMQMVAPQQPWQQPQQGAQPQQAQQPWQQPQAQQPWQQPQGAPQAQQPAPQGQQQPMAPQGQQPGGFNAQAANPPWHTPQR